MRRPHLAAPLKLSHWSIFNAEERAAMLFKTEAAVTEDPDEACRRFWSNMPALENVVI